MNFTYNGLLKISPPISKAVIQKLVGDNSSLRAMENYFNAQNKLIAFINCDEIGFEDPKELCDTIKDLQKAIGTKHLIKGQIFADNKDLDANRFISIVGTRWQIYHAEYDAYEMESEGEESEEEEEIEFDEDVNREYEEALDMVNQLIEDNFEDVIEIDQWIDDGITYESSYDPSEAYSIHKIFDQVKSKNYETFIKAEKNLLKEESRFRQETKIREDKEKEKNRKGFTKENRKVDRFYNSVMENACKDIKMVEYLSEERGIAPDVRDYITEFL